MAALARHAAAEFGTCWARTQKLTVIQMAHCVVRSFPYYPDILAIVLWVAAAENDACAISVLQHASPEATSGQCGDGDQSMGAGH